jgi:hypothetical protein
MKPNYLFLFGFLVIMVGFGVSSCGSSSSSSDDTPSGTSTISGTLSLTSSNLSTPPKGVSVAKATDPTSYQILALNAATGEQKIATVGADGSFSITAVGNSKYLLSVLDSNHKYVATLETGTIDANTLSTAFKTGLDGSTTSLGAVTADSTTGQAVSDQTLSKSTDHVAYASGGTIAGGTTGAGSTNYATTVGKSCTLKDIACPDYDYDGVPDIFDTDNDNNTYADEIDNQIDLCVPGNLKLYVENYPTCTNTTCAQMNYPTQDEVDAHLAEDTMYVIHLEFTPGTGYSMSDIEEISVGAPSYIDSFGYVYDVTNTDACFNMLWKDCNSKKLRVYTSDTTKYQIALADSDPQNLKQGRILSAMYPGDTFIATIKMTSGTTHICTKKINIIPKYYPYALKYAGGAVNPDATPTWATPASVSWTIPSRGPTGMTYAVYLAPYTDCNTVNASALTGVYSGKDASSASIAVESLPTSAVNKWGIQLWATDDIGDQSKTGWAKFKTASSSCGD